MYHQISRVVSAVNDSGPVFDRARPRLDVKKMIAGAKSGLKTSFMTHGLFIGIIICFSLALVVLSFFYEVSDSISLSLYSEMLWMSLAAYGVVLFVGRSLYIMVARRPDRLFAYVIQDIKKHVTKDRIFNAVPVFVFLPMFFSAFTSFKTMLPIMNHEFLDPVLCSYDRLLHGGVQPWELLQPLVGYPLFTCIINWLYHLWLFVMFGILIWQTFSMSDLRLRMQFFLSFTLLWIVLGTIVAGCFFSVGPCYYERIPTGDATYRPLMEYLYSAREAYPVWALNVQEDLWNSYVQHEFKTGGGISAMPSLHVAVVTLFCLLFYRKSRLLGSFMVIYTALIFIGSVHLGWHYALDGYISIAATVGIWYLSGFLNRFLLISGGPLRK